MRNLLNDTRALTFKLQATICREVDFQILSPQPISLGSFPLSTAGQGFLKLLNPTARDLSYTISAQNVELLLLLGDSCAQERKGDVKEGGTQSSRGGAQLSKDLNGNGTQLSGTESSKDGTQLEGTQSSEDGTQFLINEHPSSSFPFHPSETPSSPETQIETQFTPMKHPSDLSAIPAIPARGYEACVEVRRARVTSSALRPDEREHLESSVVPISVIPEIEGKTTARHPRLQAERPPSRAGSPRKAIGERIPHEFDAN